MAVPLDAVPVTYTPCLNLKTVADFHIPLSFSIAQRRASPLHQAQIRNEARPVILVTQVRPNNIIENVRLERLDRTRQPGNLLRPRPREPCRVDDHSRDVIQVRMRDEVRIDEGAGDVRSIGPRGGVRQCETCKGTSGECKGERGDW